MNGLHKKVSIRCKNHNVVNDDQNNNNFFNSTVVMQELIKANFEGIYRTFKIKDEVGIVRKMTWKQVKHREKNMAKRHLNHNLTVTSLPQRHRNIVQAKQMM